MVENGKIDTGQLWCIAKIMVYIFTNWTFFTSREISCLIEILLSQMHSRMVLMVVCRRYRMPFDANGCVSALMNVDWIKWIYFCLNEFEVGVNDSIFSGNEQQKVFIVFISFIMWCIKFLFVTIFERDHHLVLLLLTTLLLSPAEWARALVAKFHSIPPAVI